MREIKFRAWDRAARKFFIPVYEAWCGKLEELLLSLDGMLFIRDVSLNLTFVDDRFILMQYTGFKDKHGKEIYEGDIVLCDDNNPAPAQKCTIQWGATIEDNLETGWWLIGQKPFYNGRVKNSADLLVSRSQKHMEIIGNIYENPELASKASGAEEE